MKLIDTIKTYGLFVLIITNVTSVAHANIIVLNGLTHENNIQPGETFKGTIQVQNTGDKEKSARVYLRDYWFSYTGESKHDPAGTLERSNASWISYNPTLLTLSPNEITNIDYEIKVPDDESLRGTYWSVVMVEGITPPDTSNIRTGVKINTAIRYAIQIITNIGNSGNSDLQFLGLELSREDQNNVLNVAIENVGERMLKSEMSLELFDTDGNSAGIIKSERRKTYPGTSILISLTLNGIKPGNYNGVLVADCGEDQIFGTNLSLELE